MLQNFGSVNYKEVIMFYELPWLRMNWT